MKRYKIVAPTPLPAALYDSVSEAVKAVGAEAYIASDFEALNTADAVLTCDASQFYAVARKLGLHSLICFSKGGLQAPLVVKEATPSPSDEGYETNAKFGRGAYCKTFAAELEIERVARTAYECAEKRNRRLALVDNVALPNISKLWRKIVTDINEDYPSVQVDLMTEAQAAEAIMLNTAQFDVLLCATAAGATLPAILSGGLPSPACAATGDTNVAAYYVIDYGYDIASLMLDRLMDDGRKPQT